MVLITNQKLLPDKPNKHWYDTMLLLSTASASASASGGEQELNHTVTPKQLELFKSYNINSSPNQLHSYTSA